MKFNNGLSEIESVQERRDMPWWPGTSPDTLESPQNARLT